jgi:glutathione S-transferase
MKLYYNPKSRAVIAKWMLDECGARYDIVPIEFERGEHKTPEFLKINPAGKLPALVDGESKNLLPRSGPRSAAVIFP